MTLRGVLFLLVCAATAAAGHLFALKELLMIAVALCIVWLLAGLTLLPAVFTLRGAPCIREDHVWHRTEATLVLKVQGKCLFPVLVRWTVGFPDTDKKRYSEQLCRFGNLQQEATQLFFCPHIGEFSFAVQAELRDVFGLFRLALRGEHTVHTAVWPTTRAVTLPFSSAELVAEGTPSRYTVDAGDTFTDARRYRAGDSLKQIHWKLSLRTREWYTRQYEQEETPQMLLWVDTLLPDEDAATYRDTVCEAAASVGRELLQQGISVVLATNNGKTQVLHEGEESILYAALSAMEWTHDAAVWQETDEVTGPVTAIGGCRARFGAYVWERFGGHGEGISVCPVCPDEQEELAPWTLRYWPQELVR